MSICEIGADSSGSLVLIFRGDVVEVDTWVAASGKNGMRRDWHVRDSQTGQTITRATRSELSRRHGFHLELQCCNLYQTLF